MLGALLRELALLHGVEVGVLVVRPLEGVGALSLAGSEFVAFQVSQVRDAALLHLCVAEVGVRLGGARWGAGAGVRRGQLSELVLGWELWYVESVSLRRVGCGLSCDMNELSQLVRAVGPVLRRAGYLAEGERSQRVSPVDDVLGHGGVDMEEEGVLSNVGLGAGRTGRGVDGLKGNLRNILCRDNLLIFLIRLLLLLQMRELVSLVHLLQVPQSNGVPIEDASLRGLWLFNVVRDIAVAALGELSELRICTHALEVVDQQVVHTCVRVVLLVSYALLENECDVLLCKLDIHISAYTSMAQLVSQVIFSNDSQSGFTIR